MARDKGLFKHNYKGSFKELQGLIEELLGSLKGILGFLGLLKGVKAKATHPKPHEGRS